MESLLAFAASGLGVFGLGALASLLASFGTAVGALPALLFRAASQRTQDVLLSLAAGIMLAATVYSLVHPGLLAAEARGHGPTLAAAVVSAAMLIGAATVLLVHRLLPHEHFILGPQGPHSERLRRTWLFVIAITIHNFPEGMSVGVGFGDGSVANGAALAVAIFLQNLPEGFIVALALAAQGYPRLRAVGISCVTGFVETVGGLVGAAAVAAAAAFLPWALGFAAGAMLFVISHEIIPETHRSGYEVEATFGVLGGFVVMLLLGAALG